MRGLPLIESPWLVALLGCLVIIDMEMINTCKTMTSVSDTRYEVRDNFLHQLDTLRSKNSYTELRGEKGEVHTTELNPLFVHFAMETSGVLGEAAEEFMGELGQHLCKITGEPHCCKYLLQHISIAVQRGNAVAVLGIKGKPQLDSWE